MKIYLKYFNASYLISNYKIKKDATHFKKFTNCVFKLIACEQGENIEQKLDR